MASTRVAKNSLLAQIKNIVGKPFKAAGSLTTVTRFTKA